MTAVPEIYFHVGLGKVASTYLQQKFFPQLTGIYYVPTNQYRVSKRIIQRQQYTSYLVSREFDRQLEREVKWFTQTYPKAKVIIIFRRHDSWIASQYRRYVKNGWFRSFEEFIDLDKDNGFWKCADLLFYPKIEIIERYTGSKPLVLFHDDLKNDPWRFLDDIAQFTGSMYSQESVSLDHVHKSYSERQLLYLRSFCRRYVKFTPKGHRNRIKQWLLFRPWWAFFHLIMYAAPFLPDSWIPQEALISTDYLDRIREEYEEDWIRIKRYAAVNNPTASVAG
jgi:hypothetical protein